MKWMTMMYFFAVMMIAGESFGQVGEKVSPVNVLNEQNQTVSLPGLGEKNLLIFYADPSHPRQNKDFRNYLKSHPINGADMESYGVVNMAAAPMIPNSMIRKMAVKETKGTNAHVYFDPDEALGTAWKLPGANKNFTIIFVDKDRIIKFYKAGQITPAEQQQLLELIRTSGK